MKSGLRFELRSLALGSAMLLSACAVQNGANLQTGVSTLPQVEAALGPPAMVWKNPDGSEQLAYPKGPVGTQTYMAFVGPSGKLQRMEQVLKDAYFDQIQAGMSQEQVLRLLGPSGAPWTATYSRSNTLAWTWLYCATANMQEYFNVMFDQTTGLVRRTGKSPVMLGPAGIAPNCMAN